MESNDDIRLLASKKVGKFVGFQMLSFFIIAVMVAGLGWGWFIFVAIIGMIIARYVISGRCYECRIFWAYKFSNSEVMDRWIGTKNHTETTRDRNWKIVSTTTKQIPTSYQMVRNYYKCKKCNHTMYQDVTGECGGNHR